MNKGGDSFIFQLESEYFLREADCNVLPRPTECDQGLLPNTPEQKGHEFLLNQTAVLVATVPEQ